MTEMWFVLGLLARSPRASIEAQKPRSQIWLMPGHLSQCSALPEATASLPKYRTTTAAVICSWQPAPRPYQPLHIAQTGCCAFSHARLSHAPCLARCSAVPCTSCLQLGGACSGDQVLMHKQALNLKVRKLQCLSMA